MRIKAKYAWLALAALLSFLAASQRPLAVAAWLAPIFLLRYVRLTGALAGYLVALLCVALAQTLGLSALSPAPLFAVALSSVLCVALDLIPYLLDRLLHRRFSGLTGTLLLPVTMVGMVWLTTAVGLKTWNGFAYALHHDVAVLQVVSLTGTSGLVFLAFWLASTLNLAWEEGLGSRPSRRALVLLAVALVLVYGYGTMRLSGGRTAGASLRVAGIVPPAGPREEMMNAFLASLTEQRPMTDAETSTFRQASAAIIDSLFFDSEQQAKSGAEIVAWSETAMAVFAGEEAETLDRAGRLAAEHGVFLALGIAVLDDDYVEKLAAGEPFMRNKLVMIRPDGTVAWEYLKTKLVPFAMEARSSIAGDGVLHQVETRVGPMSGAICYDLDFPELIRPVGRRGVRLLVVPSNDWPEIKYFHSDLARLRAIENGVSVLRPTSGGLSTAVDPYGRVVGEVDYFRKGGIPLVAEIPIRDVPTLYPYIGDLFAWLCGAASLLLIAAGWRRARQARRASSANSMASGEG